MRKVIQLAIGDSRTLYALCDDGTIWVRLLVAGITMRWKQVADVGDEDDPHDEIAKLKAALDAASDLAVGLCAACRQNICDKKFLTYAHDEVGVAIINIRNKAFGESDGDSP